VVSRIKNINSIQYITDPAGSYLKFNLADGSKPTCLCPTGNMGEPNDVTEKLHEIMGPLARFDNPPGIFFNCTNVSSFYFTEKEKGYELNMSYFKGAADCFNVGEFSPEQFNKMPCSEFFEEDL